MKAKSKPVALAVSALMLAGCTGTQWIGAGSGAATGAVAGGLIGRDWKGALIGAAAGATLGWVRRDWSNTIRPKYATKRTIDKSRA
jgi:hypothetical protein